MRAGLRAATWGTETPIFRQPATVPGASIAHETYPAHGDPSATMKLTWRQHAACRGLDPLVFYPATDDEADDAKAVCNGCPVREACLEHALAVREKEGVWGGATERERRRIIRQRRRAS